VRARKDRSRNTIATEREKFTEVSASGKPIVPIKLGQGTATKWDAFFEKSSQSTRSTSGTLENDIFSSFSLVRCTDDTSSGQNTIMKISKRIP
jgi:hypothetical protein